jgi:AmmeMemoRadiSam system protein A
MEQERLVSKEEGEWLLKVARNAIHQVFDKNLQLLNIGSFLSLSLCQSRGVFVSLWKDDFINCIGHPFPDRSLEAAVQQFATQSAVECRQFSSLSVDDISSIQIKISIMTHPIPIAPNQIQIGVHGLIIDHCGQLGILLPETATGYNWTVPIFLEHLCLKAELPKDAWKKTARLYAFTTQII